MLEVNNLKITVKDKILVDNINFKINKNESLGIIGQSGSGKTLTALAIIGLLDKKIYNFSGSIKFFDREILKLQEKEIASIRLSDIAIVYQNPFNTFSPVEKIDKQIDRIYKIKKLKRNEEKISSLLKVVSLNENHLKKCPHELSGGELQRLVIITALLLKPKILICDEPTTSLDKDTGIKIVRFLDKYRREEKMSLIFITHNLNIVGKVSDKLLIMKNGKIIERGAVSEVINNPKEEYSRKLLKLFKLGDYNAGNQKFNSKL
ncbi:ABC transporter ATP-binding protein [Leptotrichia sp. OH3620_COT-345]|uniref:ATP-binding cassette domain-containing protein n=1 Tax=Leptotrichia sp. OH3620_COT-345 TaxID=2491048 RepID=UPI000F64A912|nr:ABC transporter ATP-binding protein [Leptotrichia sp. OH3620_COT-345]RRD40510.1 ABC transporter ATP-binding protein [Leptotrichia sp. OH3620_COT-345]